MAGPNSVFATISVGSNPDAGAYDSSNGYLYFANGGSSNVSVIDGASNEVISAIPAGALPSGVTVDPANGEVYVSNYGTYLGTSAVYSNVSVLYENSVIGSVAVGVYPEGIAFDGANQMIYVANAGSNNLSVINGSTNSVSAIISVGPYHTPVSVIYDPAQKDLFVAEQATNSLSVIGAINNTILDNISVGNYPGPIAYDPVIGALFVVNAGTNNVSEVSASNRSVVRSIPVGQSPDGIAFDSASGNLYVANFKSDNLTVINATTGTTLTSITVQHGPGGLTYDPSNHCIYVANYDANSVSVIQTIGSCNLPQYHVTFSESGFPKGNLWAVNFDVLRGESTSTSVSFAAANGTYPFEVPNSAGYYATPKYGTITVNGTNVSKAIQFTPIPLTTYNVTFQELGLPSGLNWSVTLSGVPLSSTSSSIIFTRTLNGTHPYSVLDLFLFVPANATGSVIVDGRSVVIDVNFSAVPSYQVVFEEIGLASGLRWSVDLAGTTQNTTGATIAFSRIPNGTYQFTVGSLLDFRATPSTGPVAVFGHNTTLQVAFLRLSLPRYSVTFDETGLGVGQRWSVSFNDTMETSTSGSILFSLFANGTYTFQVPTLLGLRASPSGGPLTVAGHDVLEQIDFAPNEVLSYTVQFLEKGLPAGVAWFAELGNRTANSTTPSLVFSGIAPGNYSYVVSAADGFVSHPGSENITVFQSNLSIAITFEAGSSVAVSGGLGSEWDLAAMFAVVVAAIGIGLVVVLRRRTDRRVHAEEMPVETGPDRGI